MNWKLTLALLGYLCLTGCEQLSTSAAQATTWSADPNELIFRNKEQLATFRCTREGQWLLFIRRVADHELRMQRASPAQEIIAGHPVQTHSSCLRDNDETVCLTQVAQADVSIVYEAIARGNDISIGGLLIRGDPEGFAKAIQAYQALNRPGLDDPDDAMPLSCFPMEAG